MHESSIDCPSTNCLLMQVVTDESDSSKQCVRRSALTDISNMMSWLEHGDGITVVGIAVSLVVEIDEVEGTLVVVIAVSLIEVTVSVLDEPVSVVVG